MSEISEPSGATVIHLICCYLKRVKVQTHVLPVGYFMGEDISFLQRMGNTVTEENVIAVLF